MAIIKIVVILKIQGQISKAQCVQKYFSCDKLCQFSLRKKCPYSELFWSVFSSDRSEYGKILRISLHSVRMQKIRARITRNTDTFHAVIQLCMAYPIGVNSNSLFQILLVTCFFPLPLPPFLHMIVIDIASNPMRFTYASFYYFASRIGKDVPITERPKTCRIIIQWG